MTWAIYALTYIRVPDPLFLLESLVIHDHGEAQQAKERIQLEEDAIHNDVLYKDKTANKDYLEYRAFLRMYTGVEPRFVERVKALYLLQHCLKQSCYPAFDSEAQQIMAHLARTMPQEALAFEAIERLDYITSAFSNYDRTPDKSLEMLVQVIRNNFDHLERLASRVMGLGQFWSGELRVRCAEVLEDYQGKMIEQKDVPAPAQIRPGPALAAAATAQG